MKEGANVNAQKNDHYEPHFCGKYFRLRRRDKREEVAKYDDGYETPATVRKSLRQSIKKHIRKGKVDDNMLERHHSVRRWRNKPSKSQISLSPKAERVREREKFKESPVILGNSSRKASYERQKLKERQVDSKLGPPFDDAHENLLENTMSGNGEETSKLWSSIRRNGLANSAPIENATMIRRVSGEKYVTSMPSKLQENTREDISATVGDTQFDLDYDGKTKVEKNNENDWETFENSKKNTQLRDFRYSLQKDRLNMDMLNLDYSYASEKEFSFGCTAMSESNTSICTENAQSMVTVSTATSESASTSINNSSSFEWYANNVMKKLESSVLSLWGMGAVKKDVSDDKLESDLAAVTFPVSKIEQQNDMHILPTRHSSLATKLTTPSVTSIPIECNRNIADVDSEIYGNHAKYFI